MKNTFGHFGMFSKTAVIYFVYRCKGWGETRAFYVNVDNINKGSP